MSLLEQSHRATQNALEEITRIFIAIFKNDKNKEYALEAREVADLLLEAGLENEELLDEIDNKTYQTVDEVMKEFFPEKG